MDSTTDISTDDRVTDTEMLEALYRAYDSWTKQYQFACCEGCAPCCTQSVTMTTLEGERIIDYLRLNGQLDKHISAFPNSASSIDTNGRSRRQLIW